MMLDFELLSAIMLSGIGLALINMKFVMHERIKQLRKENQYLKKELRRLEIDYFGEILVNAEPETVQACTEGHLVG